MPGKLPSLRPGDIVDIVAPASASNDEELWGAAKYIESLDLVPRVPQDLLKHKSSFFAAPEREAFRHLQKALTAKERSAIWCLRGGYGAQRLLPYLAKMRKPSNAKLFIGLSDISCLLNFFAQEWKWPVVHGPILARMGRGTNPALEKREMRSLLFGEKEKFEFTGLRAMNAAARKKKSVTGNVAGGNLALMQAGTGSPWSLKGKGRIVFLEDIDERGYKIDRMLLSLEQAGTFRGVKAVVFGDFIGGLEADGKSRVNEALKRFAERMPFPVLAGVKSGHGKLQRPIPFGLGGVVFRAV